MAHYLDTPRTEQIDRTRYTNPDFSELPSFQAPAGGDDLLKAMRGQKPQTVLATPSARAPLASRRNVPTRQEFTPLLQSAAKNRMRMRGREDKENGLQTPAVLKPGYSYSSPGIPDATQLGDSSMMDSSATPIVPLDSSSAMSTPLAALPQRGELGMGDGNVLTLKEQEAKLEKIDKENFGLKLKIHFLEENLRRTGPEWNQQISRENVELKANAGLMERELRKQKKTLSNAEKDLEQYRQQLKDYAEKVKRRHMDEALREEMERLQALADERAQKVADLMQQLEEAQNQPAQNADVEQINRLQDDVEDLEAELKQKDIALDEKLELIEDLQAKLQAANGDVDGELEERDQRIEEQAAELEQLREQVQTLKLEKQEECDTLQDKLDGAEHEHEAAIDDLRRQLEILEKDKRELLRTFESRLQSYDREKRTELESVQRKLDQVEKAKATDIESLELRLKLAKTQGDNQSTLAQQAAQDARDQLVKMTRERDEEVDNLRQQLSTFEGIQEELDTCQKQLQSYAEDVKLRHAEEAKLEEAMEQLKESATQKGKELQVLRGANLQQEETIEQLQQQISEKIRELDSLRASNDGQASVLNELKVLRAELADSERELTSANDKLKHLRITIEQRDAAVNEATDLRQQLKKRDDDLVTLRQTGDAQAVALEKLNELRASLTTREREWDATAEKLQKAETLAEDRAREIRTLQDTLEDRVAELEVFRDGADGPDSQLEGMQSIIRHRDQDLDDLRKLVNSHEKDLEALQKVADDRLKAAETLRVELAEMKQNLEDEIQILECSVDDAEIEKRRLNEKIDGLTKEIRGSYELQEKIEPLEKELRASEREKQRLQLKLESLERERDMTDKERASLQSTIEKLRKDLLASQKAGAENDEVAELREELFSREKELLDLQTKLRQNHHDADEVEELQHQLSEREAASAAAEVAHRQSLQTKTKIHAEEMKEMHAMLQNSSRELESLQSKLNSNEKSLRQLKSLQAQLRAKDQELYDLQEQSTRHITAQAKMQDAREEAGRLRVDIMEKEKRHSAEIRGLAKQIKFLAARLGREKAFREGLGWQKTWFLNLVEMYGICNQANLRLIEEMGITPDRSVRERRPTLRTVAQMFIFTHRVSRFSKAWSKERRVQESLMREKDNMRRKARSSRLVEIL